MKQNGEGSGGIPERRRRRFVRFRHGLAVACLFANAGQAIASDRWEEAAGGAVAIMPPPIKAKTIVGGSLACHEQRWSLRLRTEPDAKAKAGPATLRVDGDEFAAFSELEAGIVTIGVTREILSAINEGNRLSIVVAGGAADFSLRGSRAAFEAVAPRCSPVDMSAYQRITLTDRGIEAAVAQGLMAAEEKLFRAAAGKRPAIAAAMLDPGGGRGLLFASLCGPSSYYGLSGCTLRGFARADAGGEWREIYNSEGMALYADPKAANDGWPDLLALPAGETTAVRWSWTEAGYAMRKQILAEDTELRGTVQ